jgi:hypothetical protein
MVTRQYCQQKPLTPIAIHEWFDFQQESVRKKKFVWGLDDAYDKS